MDKISNTPAELASNFRPTSPNQWPGHMADDVASTSGPEPLALLTATADELELTSTRGNFRIPRLAITKIGRGCLYPWFFSAVRIHHRIAGYPRDLQFKPFGMRPRDLRGKLLALGYAA